MVFMVLQCLINAIDSTEDT